MSYLTAKPHDPTVLSFELIPPMPMSRSSIADWAWQQENLQCEAQPAQPTPASAHFALYAKYTVSKKVAHQTHGDNFVNS